ncbi:MAG: NAD(P)-dependent oxidoreductase [Chthoniobacteraceae bacterium]
MRILITGATGFIGRACACAALARGHEVAALVRPGSSRPVDAALVRIDGELARPDWRAIEAFAPDSCLHTAWIATPGEYLLSPLNHDYLDWSVAFLHGLAGRGVRHCIATGTCLEYAPQDGPLREDASPLAPASPYARSKDALRRAMESSALDLGWARIFLPFGPGEDPRRLPTSIIQHTLKQESIVLKTPDSIRDFVFIGDVAGALLTALEHRFCGSLNVGTGVGVSVREFAAHIARLLGEPARVIAAEAAVDPYPAIVADPARLCALGWRPRTSIEDGLAQIIRSFAPESITPL